jgi:hypothetical protein
MLINGRRASNNMNSTAKYAEIAKGIYWFFLLLGGLGVPGGSIC